jgi:hypothetical protein
MNDTARWIKIEEVGSGLWYVESSNKNGKHKYLGLNPWFGVKGLASVWPKTELVRLIGKDGFSTRWKVGQLT